MSNNMSGGSASKRTNGIEWFFYAVVVGLIIYVFYLCYLSVMNNGPHNAASTQSEARTNIQPVSAVNR
jgi:zona occludens toxin (predicted ATPase)